ncbi:carbohydrate ABC transporter permease [Spirilliplanes yamanashiensis]|uniref:Glycerol-3-phosphate ABC transporter permease n=1 Tax=Spirilliplanes yamanashiensis TaxID=42233 RepID=A0A8J3Y3J0_9ACTN|nr:sugar ABC transporter permease [Spirilliplanes yamanashiensis]MDP9814204.1 multiple sugar transport system permease protein [Spirilliplanes yamanashiensis]GIJ00814.1 glycerol-3-phosphate ABC transporter permease [Spirilliplanes yamanashiensis]
MVEQTVRPATRPVPPVTPAPAAPRRRGPGAAPWLFLAPYLVLFTTFTLVPAVYGLWISLHEWDYLLPGKPFVGVDNYGALLDSGSAVYESFWQSMQATGIFTVFTVPLLVALPLGVALILNRAFPGRTFFRAVYFAPYVLSVAVVGLLWRFVLDPNLGVVNAGLGAIGLPGDTPWTTGLPWAWISLVGVTVWWTLGFNAVIYLAGLQDIPRELYEAASIDGGGKWAAFRHVTLPGLRPVLLFIVINTVLASANMFGQAYLITQGAPGQETRTAIMYIAEEGLRNYRMGSAAAMSYVLTLALLIISLIVFRLFREKDPS